MVYDQKTSEFDIVTWESLIEAPRWVLREGSVEIAITDWNWMLKNKGWEPVELVYNKEYKTFMTRTIMFKIRGQRYPVELFRQAVASIATNIT